MTLKSLIPLLLLLHITYSIDFPPNSGPVIGILTSPRSGIHSSESEIKMTNYEFLLSGGQVNIIPIPWDLETKRFNQLLNSVNGVLLTGGTSRLWTEDEEGNRAFSPYQRTVNYLMYYVMKKNKSGVYFPVWAICQGYEAVAIALTKDLSVLDTFKHNDRYEPITFTDKAQRSKMFQHYSKEDFIFAEKNPSVFYKHDYGLNTSVPRLYPAFSEDKWVITSINEDENGKEFINSMEMKGFPIFIHMFHPERALHDALYQKDFESASRVVSVASKLAQAFLTEAQKNDNGFASLTLQKGLAIENFEKEEEYYVFTRDSFKDQWLSVYSDVVDWFIWGVLGVIAVGMISCVVWMYMEREKREHPKVNYERIDAVRI